ncbi:uncharacterized protein F4807DRAFT_430286 [Annulohypoxylon truncatum]|uniref:uncharacterized protein n=1 Tax=Annulohypoxylon truncatum TaxID=327061 RepID=UPI002008C76E|nr:uncharacterized protein F4807DRAFT_430286 [Annulohypoxylon truncatum]KAI1208598.1 hypothetical protein F4807DRAFT_430286 [Annulohypoxylon truncatum]
MNSFSYLLLAVISLSVSVLGGVLPDKHPEIRPCAPGTKMCHEDTVYRCSSLGTWVDNIQCIPPAHCFEDKHTQDAGCVDSHAELKRSDPTTTSAPYLFEDAYHGPPGRPSTSKTTTISLTSDEHIKPGPHTGDLRCNGPVEEIYDDSTGWRVVQRCKECHTFSDGTINCAPLNPNVPTPTPCQISTFRCAGKWMEACADGYHWQKLEKCLDCKETGHGVVNCAPDNLPPIPPHPVCKMGALRCRGNWFEFCNAGRQWQSVQRCAKCLESGTGGVSCEQPNTAQPADPTKPAASPTVLEVTPVAAAARTPAPELPDFEFPTGALKPDPDMEVAKDNPCFGGEVKCNGDRINVCMASHQWEDFGPVRR